MKMKMKKLIPIKLPHLDKLNNNNKEEMPESVEAQRTKAIFKK